MEPLFIMLVGLPYSGKSTLAAKLSQEQNAVVHSSDAIRAEVTGDIQNQEQNADVFEILHSRVIADLKAGKNTIFDATNISYKRRMDTLLRLRKIPCRKICYFMAVPFSQCVERSQYRERVVPYEVLERMYRAIWIPNLYEGWDEIQLVYPVGFEPYSVCKLFMGKDGLDFVKQDNPHHNLTVGQHCTTTFISVAKAGGSQELQEAALLHDIGKPFTKTFVNTKGETTDVAHYYDHQHVSAYDSLFYSNPGLDRLYIAAIIQWHMRPFELEREPVSPKAVKKFKRLVGRQLYADIMALHKADIQAKGSN